MFVSAICHQNCACHVGYLLYIAESEDDKSMRKLTVEFAPKIGSRLIRKFSNKIKSIEILQMLNINLTRGEKLFISTFTLRDGSSLSDLENLRLFEILDMIKSDGNKYTCLTRARIPPEFIRFNKMLDVDLIWDTPLMIAEDKFVVSVIGNKDGLKKVLEVIKMVGKPENIIVQSSTYQEHNILSCLTDRQKEIILKAKKYGYYDYPRRINGDQLAQSVGISKAVTIEHLRKAEARIMSNILSGY